jgi:5-methylcytosine-specific restriction protein A
MPRQPPSHRPRSVGRKTDRPSSAAQGYGAAWRRLRAAFLAAHPLCEACAAQGVLTPASHVDHRIAKAAGGTDDEENLAAYCPSCHSRKTCQRDQGFGRPPKTG